MWRWTVRWVLVMGLAANMLGCGTTLEEEDPAEVEPVDPEDNLAEQGLYSCSERSDTGYSSGNAFNITVVTVDGRPVERPGQRHRRLHQDTTGTVEPASQDVEGVDRQSVR